MDSNPALLAGAQPPAAAAHGARVHARRARRDRRRAVGIYRPLPAFAAATGLRPEEWAALDRIPARLSTPLLFPAPQSRLLNLDNLRRREWALAIEASGVTRPARSYDLRSTFASRALAAGVPVFELAKIMGTSAWIDSAPFAHGAAGARASAGSRHRRAVRSSLIPFGRFGH
jgi:hypothetical protein